MTTTLHAAMPSFVVPCFVVPSSVATTAVVGVPAAGGHWSRARFIDAAPSSGTTLNAQAAKHGKAVDPPRGASV